MREHVGDGFLFFLLHVGDFTHGDVFLALEELIDGVKIAAKNVLGLIVVAEPELQSQDGAQRNELVEYGVIADGPRNAAEDDDRERLLRRW